MAPRHREIEHALDDGFVVAWDSAEVDDALRDQLIEAASERIQAALGKHDAGEQEVGGLAHRGQAAA
jgi:hypothetical protein